MITVTKPLESAVKKVQGTTVVKSSTSRGSCVIDVYFQWGLDIYALKTQLESRINEIKNFLPAGTVISTEAMNQSLFPVYGFTLESDTHSRIALRDAGNLVVRPMFSQVNGISNVVVRGGKAKEFVVKPDPVKMSALGITPAQIKDAFSRTNFVSGNGQVADYNRLYLSLTDTRIDGLEELKEVVIRNDGKRIIRLRDFARVEIQEQQEFLKINADGKDAVLVDLVKQPGVNLLTFARDVEAKAEEIRAQLPEGYELKPYYNQSAFVGDSIHSVLKTIYEGLFLAIVVMVLFLRSWRSSLVVMLTIPVTVAFSILLCYLVGITINVMSLGAMAASVGLIIDDAIVIIEQIYREHEERPDADRFAVVRHAIRGLFPAMVASSLATIVIHFPFRLMSGLAGSFFKELSDTMQLTMAASFLVTWLLLPVLHLMTGYRKRLRPKSPDVKGLEEASICKVHFLTVVYRKPAGASIVFIPNENKLSQFGISLTDFQEQLQAYTGGIPLSAQANIIEPHPAQAAMTGGLQIGSVQDGEQMRRILLRFTDFPDNSPELLRRQPVFLPDGSIRPLETLCDIRIIPGEIEQRREDLKSNITLTARLEGRDLGSAVQDLQREFKQQLHLPSGYSISFGGAYSEQQQSFRELTAILLLATLLVLTVLMFLLREWRISFAVLFISLMGICDCLLALWITGVPLNVSSYTGIIMIVGILAENSIFTVWQYKTNRRNSGTVDESVDYAIALRIRPKLMTAIGAVLALMPLALGLGMGAQMQQPLAVAVIGGFTVGLPLLLVVLPALMRWIYRKSGNSSNFI